ncbi:putative aliphatic sulfonates transport permease protein SsuC [Pseudodesulfovibrio hydrargyri]|uniref:Putative aliphatic sulfonates transport permease protein SsuC n=1 Tax=Pseudodesulfovibrio hydrargyri TaxID=2125990 RepID=A0A1J5MYJ1_9BACT|nr:ABC transporter permease [Pseudodesulfovibrio hydrargyri]OIQ50908.1 putative aliphatic sulfonates transport permease protein SsuC [Pseudodesulfovibrio hydrargyri]
MFSSWFTVRKELNPRRKLILTIMSFILPLVAWSIVSYCPYVWHPLVEITNAGDTSVKGDYDYVAKGQLVEKDVFESRNKELAAAGATLAQGDPANPIYLPAPHKVARAFYTAFTAEPQRRGDKWLHESLWHSFKIIFWGFLYSALLGVPLGIMCGTYDFFTRLTEPFVDFIRYMPAPVFGALAVAILGLKDAPKITVIFIGTFFQMVLIVANTTRQLDGSLLEAAQTLGASSRQLLTKIVIPGILPRLYADMRILMGWAWTYLVVAELIGEKSGITSFLYQQQRYRNFDNVYAAIIMIGLIGLLTDQVMAFFGRHLFPWESETGSIWKKVQINLRAENTGPSGNAGYASSCGGTR